MMDATRTKEKDMAHDLPRDPGTLYAVRNATTGKFIRCADYIEAHALWLAGTTIYTKDDARGWGPIPPPEGTCGHFCPLEGHDHACQRTPGHYAAHGTHQDPAKAACTWR